MKKLLNYILLFYGAATLFSYVGAAEVSFKAGPYGVMRKQVRSLKELKFRGIVRQETDYSCGAASLATILRYFYGEKVSEEEIVRWLLENGDLKKISQRGFSLLDLKIYANNRGYKADGYRLKAEQLKKVKIPTIVLLNYRGYAHFVVLKGVRNGYAYIADPALGNRRLSMDRFVNEWNWNGIIFVVYKKGGKRDYNRFAGPLAMDKAEVWRMKDLMLRNLFMDTSEFRR